MSDEDDRYIEAVRAQYRMMCELEAHIERTDRVALVSAMLVAIVAIFFSTLDGYEVFGIVLGALAGGFFGHVWAYRRMRKRSFAQLTDSYQEIELQEMAKGELNGD